jgi:hypothetical protein
MVALVCVFPIPVSNYRCQYSGRTLVRVNVTLRFTVGTAFGLFNHPTKTLRISW